MIEIKFKNDLKKVLKDAFEEIKNKKAVYQFGIKTDGDVSTLLVACNTFEHYEKVSKSTLEKYNVLYTESRWNIDEWINDELASTNDLLNKINNYINIEPFESLDIDQKLDIIAESLIEVKKEGLFNEINNSPILFMDFTDDYIKKKMIDRIKLLINDESIYSEFYKECIEE